LFASGSDAALAAKKPKDVDWRGLVEAVDGGFDYVGRPCPEKAEVCAQSVARYPIQPNGRSTSRALEKAAGSDARLKGHLEDGRLVVKKVTALGPPSGVEGTVTMGPVCHLRGCPDVPVEDWQVELIRQDGSKLGSARTDKDGKFRIAAPPGSYTVRAAGSDDDCTSPDVQVDEGRFTSAQVRCDTGIEEMDNDPPPAPPFPQLPPVAVG
jgi:carboxypeptidase family protein